MHWRSVNGWQSSFLKVSAHHYDSACIYVLYVAMTRTVLFLILVEEERTEILKSGLDLAVQYRNLAKTEVGIYLKCAYIP